MCEQKKQSILNYKEIKIITSLEYDITVKQQNPHGKSNKQDGIYSICQWPQ